MRRFHPTILWMALGLALTVVSLAGPATAGTASDALMEADAKMDDAMRQPMTGDPDVDFVVMMRAHHQGAIDMAKVELQYGTDPEIRAMAQAIVDAQTKEIGQLDAWLRRRQPR